MGILPSGRLAVRQYAVVEELSRAALRHAPQQLQDLQPEQRDERGWSLPSVAFQRDRSMEDTAIPLWAFVVIGGPILLGLALAYSRIRNRRRRRSIEARRGHRG
jgi:hypothetical protein